MRIACRSCRSSEPRLTVTTHTDARGERLWYLGGQLASDGVDAQRRGASKTCARGIGRVSAMARSLRRADRIVVRRSRGTPEQSAGRRPDQAYVATVANALICWPTKLALAPDLGDKVLAQLAAPSVSSSDASVTSRATGRHAAMASLTCSIANSANRLTRFVARLGAVAFGRTRAQVCRCAATAIDARLIGVVGGCARGRREPHRHRAGIRRQRGKAGRVAERGGATSGCCARKSEKLRSRNVALGFLAGTHAPQRA